MSLISRAINHLFGGVSQQAAALRDPSQCELMENCWPDVAEGLGKRPPLVHGAKLNTDTSLARKVHLIDRDSGEQYAVILKNSELKVYDRLTGAEKTVSFPDGTGYLASTDPLNDFSLVTVADTTFIVNKTKTVTMGAAAGDASVRPRVTVKFNSLPTDHGCIPHYGGYVLTVNGTPHTLLLVDSTPIEDYATAFATYLTSLYPSSVFTASNDELIMLSEPGGTLAVTGYALDEVLGDCSNPVQNPSRVTLTTATESANNVAFVVIKSGVIKTGYNIYLDGLSASYTTGADFTKTDGIASSLADQINGGTFFLWGTGYSANTTYQATVLGSVIKIVKKDGSAFSCRVSDGWGDQAMMSFTDSVESSSELPPNFWPGYVVKVRGHIDSGKDDFYVHYEDEIWKETVAPGLANDFVATSMPHKLVRNADGTFTFSKITWGVREVGDADSNPEPSFVGLKINNIFFHRERLGLLAGENIIMSRVADYYTFWNSTASGQLDDDPIDVSVADVKVSYLYHALPFQDTLLVFSDSAQYQLTGGDVLSAATVRLDPTTRFSASKKLPPTAAGRNVFFTVNRGAYSSMREYFVMPQTATTDAVDITAHVPAYLPSSLADIVSSSLNDCVVAVSSAARNELFVYKFLWDGERKVQSSWSKWILDSDASVVGISFTNSTCVLVVVRNDGTYVETINLQSHGKETGMDRIVYLDRRYSLTGVYDPVSKKTAWTLPHADTGDYQVVLGAGYGNAAGLLLNSTKIGSTTIEANGDFSTYACFVGKPYSKRFRFSEFFLKDKEGIAMQTGRLQLRTLTVSFSDTGYFRCEVTPKYRETFSYPFTARIIGGVSSIIGSNPILTGKMKFPVVTNSNGCIVDLVNDSPSPSFFQGAEWEGLYVQRTQRV